MLQTNRELLNQLERSQGDLKLLQTTYKEEGKKWERNFKECLEESRRIFLRAGQLK